MAFVLSRRRMLTGATSLTAAAVAAPFYRMLAHPKRARAAGVAKRIIFWFTPNGTVHAHWRPTGSGASYGFAPGSILEPLDAHKAQLLVLDGLNFERSRSSNHEGGMEHMLTGGGNPSLDQFLATKIGGDTPFSSIELGVQTSAWGSGIQTRMSYNDAHAFVHPEDNPAAAPLQHHQFAKLDALESREASGAFGTETPATDRCVILGRTGIFDLRIVRAARGAPHSAPRKL